MVVVCWISYNFARRSLKKIARHIGSAHSHEADFRLVCGINLCPRVYTKFLSFKRRLFRYHKSELGQSEVNISISSLSQSDIDGDVLQLAPSDDVEKDDETVSVSHHNNRLDPELEKRISTNDTRGQQNFTIISSKNSR